MKLRRLFTLLAILIFGLVVGQLTFSDENHKFSDYYSLFFSLQEKVTKLIVAEHGGSLELSGVSITIPPDALNEDTRITLSSVKGSRFDGDVSLGGVNGLHMTGAVFEPDGVVLNSPAIVRFSLPKNWSNDNGVAWSAANSNDPLNVLETTEEITVTGSPSAYIAEVKLSHFSSGMVSENCHAGTYNNVANEFKKNGCTDELIKDEVATAYDGITIDPKNARTVGANNIQAFLGTYFDIYGPPYNEGEDLDIISYLEQQVTNGRQVVIAFTPSKTWPQKGIFPPHFYPSFPHTATLLKDENGMILVRHTLSTGGYKGAKLKILLQCLGTPNPSYPDDPTKNTPATSISYTDPLDNINNFRTMKNGEAFRKYVQTYIKGQKQKECEEVFTDDFFVISKPYKSLRIYIDRREDDKQNACDSSKIRELRNCQCACNLQGTQFWCRYDTEFLGWSPSCRDLTNGPCICTAYGCVRLQPVTSGVCYDKCINDFRN